MGRTVLTVDPDGDASQMAYDTFTSVSGTFNDGGASGPGGGMLLTTVATDPLGHTQQSLTDGAGRTLQTRDAENKVTAHAVDANGNVVATRDPNNVGDYFCLFDARDRKVECQDTQEFVDGKKRLYTYDAHNNVVA